MSPAVAVLLAAATLAATPSGGYTFPPVERGDVKVTLTVRVAERGPAPGQGRVTLTVVAEGPPELEVEPVQLEDAVAGWSAPRRASSWSSHGGRVTGAQTVELVQVKPGVVPLPGVRVRWRERGGGPGEQAKWTDILKEARPAPPAEELPPLPPSPWPGRLRAAAVGLSAGLALLLSAWGWRRWRRSAPAPRPPQRLALDELGRTAAEAERAPAEATARAADVVRAYLAGRFGVRAEQQTTGEFLEGIGRSADFPGGQLEALRAFLGGCDLVKFSGLALSPEEARGLVRRGRELVEAIGPGGEEGVRAAGAAGQGEGRGKGVVDEAG
jgi:hypothetical protein